ncbi:MAG: cobalamin biosynthesis protein CobD [Clostridiaceae bacterium]|jgi:adenosylcobinamide-phosphate synthase|nr:cobalamin biosynthesis protein CobD [Clostridiaceae bacterium]
MLIYSTLAIIIGFLLDLIIGDPQGWPHLVRLLGALISVLEKALYNSSRKRQAGTVLVVTVLFVSAAVSVAMLAAAWLLSPWLYLAVASLLCWQILAARSLAEESKLVYNALQNQDLPAARQKLAMIVGRDTTDLEVPDVVRATVETIAENTADGIIAPLFYFMLGGIPAAIIYKAINTMDSMLGYQNDRYREFGRRAALLDDVANYLPARLSALIMLLASAISGFSVSGAWKIWRRDRRKHKSPNAGQTEAVMAGALGIVLGGASRYGGVMVEKPALGDPVRAVEIEDIKRAQTIKWWTTALMLILILICRTFLILLLASRI